MCRTGLRRSCGYVPDAGNGLAPVSVLLPANSPQYHRPRSIGPVVICPALTGIVLSDTAMINLAPINAAGPAESDSSTLTLNLRFRVGVKLPTVRDRRGVRWPRSTTVSDPSPACRAAAGIVASPRAVALYSPAPGAARPEAPSALCHGSAGVADVIETSMSAQQQVQLFSLLDGLPWRAPQHGDAAAQLQRDGRRRRGRD